MGDPTSRGFRIDVLRKSRSVNIPKSIASSRVYVQDLHTHQSEGFIVCLRESFAYLGVVLSRVQRP